MRVMSRNEILLTASSVDSLYQINQNQVYSFRGKICELIDMHLQFFMCLFYPISAEFMNVIYLKLCNCE